MVRRGRSASPPPRPMARSNVPARAPAPAHPPAPAPQHAQPPMMAQPQQPSMMAQMAVTAGGVAIGSAVGHTLGHAMTGMFSGSDDKQPAAAAAPAQSYNAQPAGQPNQPSGPCAWEVSQFIQCAQNQGDLTLCEGFNEALRQCKQSNNMSV